jgi:hypothetical protein
MKKRRVKGDKIKARKQKEKGQKGRQLLQRPFEIVWRYLRVNGYFRALKLNEGGFTVRV